MLTVKTNHIISICLAVVFSGCLSGASDNINATINIIWGSPFCGAQSKPGLVLITSGAELKRWRDGQSQVAPVIRENFSKHYLLVVNMGQQPSGGYGLALQTEQAGITGHQLIIPLQWQEPKAGMMQAQVITNPCLLISIPRDDHYNAITVLDQDMKNRFILKIQPATNK